MQVNDSTANGYSGISTIVSFLHMHMPSQVPTDPGNQPYFSLLPEPLCPVKAKSPIIHENDTPVSVLYPLFSIAAPYLETIEEMTASEFFRFHQGFQTFVYRAWVFRRYWTGWTGGGGRQTDPLLFLRYETKSKTRSGFFFRYAGIAAG